MITAANWKIENGRLVILCTDGQGWWHPIKVSITGEYGETCIIRQEARVDEDWSRGCGDGREIADYGYGFLRGISVHDTPIPENREEDKAEVDLPEVLTMRPEVFIRKHIPEYVQGVDRWNLASDMAINSIIEKHVPKIRKCIPKSIVDQWEEWAEEWVKDCPNP